MPKLDAVLQTIRAVHSAGLDETLWPAALAAMADLLGMAGANLEAMEPRSKRLTGFWAHGLPPGAEISYAAEYMAYNPRRTLEPSDSGGINYDYLMLPEEDLNRHPFYQEFLSSVGLRYFMSLTLLNDDERFACIAFHRTPDQGHVGREQIELLRQLSPHLRQAYEVNRRFQYAMHTDQAFEQALHWLRDGALLVGRSGEVIFANEAALTLIRREPAIKLTRNRLEFQSPVARVKWDAALAAAQRLAIGEPSSEAVDDFHVPRQDDNWGYIVAVRPIALIEESAERAAIALVFIRNQVPVGSGSAGVLAREIFGFTESEANLADALIRGSPLPAYAAAQRVSMNTVYTHLKRIKDKTGARRLPELVAKLTELRSPLQPHSRNGALQRR